MHERTNAQLLKKGQLDNKAQSVMFHQPTYFIGILFEVAFVG